ncbi:MAG TPA: PAS domain-containing sensor histidine kinase [Gammaproteobacteria bacterium]|nr:PAS domain-containing sensor histidine kinase [Gammaproteobacteria bacterium]
MELPIVMSHKARITAKPTAPVNASSRNLLDHLESAVLWVSPTLELLYVNPAAEMLLERSLNRLKGESLKSICPGNSELVQMLEKASDTELSVTRRNYRLKINSNQAIKVNLTVNSISQVGIVVEMQRIDRARDIDNEFKLQKEQEAIRGLIRGLAHEIKNPLGGIRGAAQLLQSELADQPELLEYTDVLIKETDRLKSLIDQMSGPRRQPQKQRVNIHEISERVRKLLAAEAPDSIRIRFVYDPSAPEVVADKDQLIQATLNLARNALESLEETGGDLVISTSVVRKFTIGNTLHPLAVSLKIEDNGPGIPESLQPQIFFPMVTGKATGTGLGLPTSRSLVDAQGGIIQFKSRPGHTEFEILLPAAPQDHE